MALENPAPDAFQGNKKVFQVLSRLRRSKQFREVKRVGYNVSPMEVVRCCKGCRQNLLSEGLFEHARNHASNIRFTSCTLILHKFYNEVTFIACMQQLVSAGVCSKLSCSRDLAPVIRHDRRWFGCRRTTADSATTTI